MRIEPLARAERVVLTGGPGAGKTAVLELASRQLCGHVVFVPEAAGILFRGGFPRPVTPAQHRAAQRAIFRVQRELEQMAAVARPGARTLCDRGTLDGLAYWPGTEEALFAEVGSSLEEELSHYRAVIHLEVPEAADYQPDALLRPESHAQALEIDRRILRAWARHPHRVVVPHSGDFLEKARRALVAIRQALPECPQCAASGTAAPSRE
jgi:predicted ATPase